MDAIIGPWDQEHDYGNDKLSVPSDFLAYPARGRPTYTLDEQRSNGYGDLEIGRMGMERFPYLKLPKSAGAPAVQQGSSNGNGGIRTRLENEAGDTWSFSDLSGPLYELQHFTDLDAYRTTWQMLEAAVPHSEEPGQIVRSEFADIAVPDPSERSMPSPHLTAVPDLSWSLSNSTASIAGSSRQTVWDVMTGQEVPRRSRRRLTTQERADSQAIRSLGGQCLRCRRGKRKCHRSHNRPAMRCSLSDHDSEEDNSPSSVYVAAHTVRHPTTVPRSTVDDPEAELLHLRQENHPGETVDAAEIGSWLPQLDSGACSSIKEHQAEAPIVEQGSPANEAGSYQRPPGTGINVSGVTDASGQSGKHGNTMKQSIYHSSTEADETGRVRTAKRAKKTAEEKELELRCPEYAAGEATLGKCSTFSSKSVDRLKSDHLKKDHGFARDKLDIGRRKQGETEPDLWRRLFLKLHPNWLNEHPKTPSPYVNPNRDLSEVALFNSPRPFDEPRRSAHHMRDIDGIASSGILADDMLQWNQPQATSNQRFPSERTHAMGTLSPSTSLFPPSTPHSMQVPQTPLAFARNSPWNQSQAPHYRLFPSEGNAFSVASPLEYPDAPSTFHPSEGYKDLDSEDFQMHHDFTEAQSDIVLNGYSAPSSSASSGARNSDQTVTTSTSVTRASKCSRSGKSEICRCKRHDDCCKLQFFEGTEKCTGCDGFFTWSRKAEPFLTLGDVTCQICRCRWHDKRCLEYRELYDAGKCIGCGRWLAFSDRADSLLIFSELPGEAPRLEDDLFSTMVNSGDSAN